MISVRRHLLAFAGGLLLVPFGALAQSQEEAQTAALAAQSHAPQPEGENAEDKATEDEKRVCRSVRADPSSRRKTKVCRTVEEWRKLNVPL